MNLPIGTLLQGGKYEIKRFISAGGFGCTYEGVHTMLDTHIAIKEFFVKDFCNRDEQTSHVTVGTQSKVELVQKLRRKFIDEAKAIYKMQHNNIVRVLDIFEENGTAYCNGLCVCHRDWSMTPRLLFSENCNTVSCKNCK